MSIDKRVIDESNYMLNTNKTIREIANYFNISKSTVHKDLTKRLPLIDHTLFNKIEKILDNHLSLRHIRGGEKTRLKYKGYYEAK